ncbi:MAG TPA: hypothetical protein PLE24_10475, partial [Chitinispirillaceae bacterium]|nr:hypothetical protein [Chitinispirillaceae bacterium]
HYIPVYTKNSAHPISEVKAPELKNCPLPKNHNSLIHLRGEPPRFLMLISNSTDIICNNRRKP